MTHHLLDGAVKAYEAQHYEECARLCASALACLPDDEGLLTLQGIALQACGRFDGMAEVFGKLTELRPEIGEYWSNLGVALRHRKSFAEAETMFHQALLLPHPIHDTLVNYGLLLLDMGRIGEARLRFLDACEVEGHSADARIQAALACIECGDTPHAEALIPPPAAWGALDQDLRQGLTKVLIHLGRVTEAEALLRADVYHAKNPFAIARLASLYERTNRLDESGALLESIRQHTDPDIQLDALTLDAALAIRKKEFSRARTSTQTLLNIADLPPQAQANAHFAMATVADKQGCIEEAMEHLVNAHRLQFGFALAIEPEIATSADEPLRIATTWLRPDEAVFLHDSEEPTAEQSPVFIVGFPRSGTTMLEQMLDAHPAYVSMDERVIIQDCIGRMRSRGFTYPNQLNHLGVAEMRELRALYWSQAARVARRRDDQILVDKNPLNMLRLPMIRRLFPSARIILALRHPCDVILSCYMQNFRSPAFMVLCSTLERLANSYINAMNFWIHHQPLLPPDPLILRYEDTVMDFAAQVENIAAFLGIQDRHPLETFAEHASAKRYISTPSYSQVIKPVNRSAMGRWLPYRSYFGPLFPFLRPVAEHWGYVLPEL